MRAPRLGCTREFHTRHSDSEKLPVWRLGEESAWLQVPSPLSAAAAAKALQACPTLCDPVGASPPGSAVPGMLQAGTLEWVAISFSNA